MKKKRGRVRQNIRGRKILQLFPEGLFKFLCKEYNVDHKVIKLTGEVLVLTIIEVMLSGVSFSLRNLAKQYEEPCFQRRVLKREHYTTIDRTAFSHRLKKINPLYFKRVFVHIKAICEVHFEQLPQTFKTIIFDTTSVTCSLKRLKKTGYQTTGKQVRQIKYTMGIDGCGRPIIAECHTEKRYNSDNIALGETIMATKNPGNHIILFDRGLHSREKFDAITERGLLFISRLRKGYRADIIEEKAPSSVESTSGLTKVIKAHLFTGGYNKKTKYTYRIVHLKPRKKETTNRKPDRLKQSHAFLKWRRPKHAGKTKEELYKEIEEEEIIFVTNVPEERMSPQEIADRYKSRWQIECFFRMIKQQLSFSHLLNRTENGIQTIMYLTMVAAIILLVYKSLNAIEGDKNVKETLIMDMRARAPGVPVWKEIEEYE